MKHFMNFFGDYQNFDTESVDYPHLTPNQLVILD